MKLIPLSDSLILPFRILDFINTVAPDLDLLLQIFLEKQPKVKKVTYILKLDPWQTSFGQFELT